MKKGKKCPKCNSPYSNFSLKIWKEKITDSLFCEECDKEEIEKAVNSEWEKWQKQNEEDLTNGRKGGVWAPLWGGKLAHSKYIRRKPGT